MNDQFVLALVATGVFLAAGTVKGLLGIGLPTMAVGLMAQFVDVREAVALAIVPMLLANAWQMSRGGEPRALAARVLGRYRALATCMLVTIGAVALLAPAVPPAYVALALGTVMVAFALSALLREPPPLPARFDARAQWLSGVLAGVFGGLAGVWAPPIIVYLGARRLPPEEFVETVGVLLFVGSVVLFAGYLANGMLDAATTAHSLLLTLPTLAGFALGESLRRRVSPARFRTLVLVFFLLMGLNLARRALSGAL